MGNRGQKFTRILAKNQAQGTPVLCAVTVVNTRRHADLDILLELLRVSH